MTCAKGWDDMPGPLAGVKILAVEQYGAGPFGTQQLADLGATVIKIENRRMGGEYARELGPFYVEGANGTDRSLFFQSINRGKKSLTLDLGHPKGKEIFGRLIASADAVANNLRGDVPEKLGITYDALKDSNPAIVCAHCSAYGRTGERKTWPGYDFLMQAEAGYFHMSGEPDTPPTRMGLSVVDFMAGTYMALGLVSGVIGARSTGRGRDIDVNLYDTALYNLSYLSAWALNTDYEPARAARSAHASLAPCQLYKTQDGWIYIMCNKEKFWELLCEKIECPELKDDPRFIDFGARLQNREQLTLILDAAFSRRSTNDWLSALRGEIPIAPVRTPREALKDPALAARGNIAHTALVGGQSFDLLTSPISTGDPQETRACTPLGHDTLEILKDIGFSGDQVAELKEQGLI